MRIRTITALLTAAALVYSSFPRNAAAADSPVSAAPSQQDIRAFYAAHPFSHAAPVYAEPPQTEAPYSAGSLSAETLEEALNCLNLCRYAAGVPADIQLADHYNAAAQAGQLTDYLNGTLQHHPPQPDGLPQEIYARAYQGNSNSDLWCGCRDLPESVAVYLLDPGASNLQTLGHRRWLLNPAMRYTGFGYVEGYTGCYVTERGRAERFTGDFIAWPPQNMPYELYAVLPNGQESYPFSVTLGEDYDLPQQDQIRVRLYSQMLERYWDFDADSITEPMFLRVDTEYYGSTNCIIFDTGDTVFDCDDVLTVSISGITKSGTDAPLTYQIRFFRLNDGSALPDNGEPVRLAGWLLCNPEAALDNPEPCDCNGDGVLDARDLSAVKQMILER